MLISAAGLTVHLHCIAHDCSGSTETIRISKQSFVYSCAEMSTWAFEMQVEGNTTILVMVLCISRSSRVSVFPKQSQHNVAGSERDYVCVCYIQYI